MCEEGKLLYPITTPIKRASFYTGMPRRMIQRIKREWENSYPGKYANEQDMVDWLQANGCLAHISMRKTVLYDFIGKLKLPENIYKIDQIFNVHGHAVIRLPPCMCDLNQIELAWSKLKT
jgi:hypothetical protein